MSSQTKAPWESWWRVGGHHDVYEPNPDAGKVGRVLGYDGDGFCILQVCQDGELLRKTPHQLFPAERPEGAEAMPAPELPRAESDQLHLDL